MITYETRHESHEKIIPKAFSRQQEIMSAIGDSEMTAREIKDKLGYKDMNDVKPRITELLYQGQLVTVGKRKDNKTGRKVAVYKAVR